VRRCHLHRATFSCFGRPDFPTRLAHYVRLLLAARDGVTVRLHRRPDARFARRRSPVRLLHHTDVIHNAAGDARLVRRVWRGDRRLASRRVWNRHGRIRHGGSTTVPGLLESLNHSNVEIGLR